MHALGESLSIWWTLPFAGMLLAIAILPLVVEGWYSEARNLALVAAVFGAPVIIYLLAAQGAAGSAAVLDAARQYFSFIVLLGSLFTIAGGIHLTGDLLGSPRSNVTFLAVGAVLASLIGTTAAAMVLVRPLLRATAERRFKAHTMVFAIFIVANIGGLLTPIGDPPLFLGFLQGVPFFWTLRLLPEWALAVGVTLLVYLLVDRHYYAREAPSALLEDVADYKPTGIDGKRNVIVLVVAVATIMLSPTLARFGDSIHFHCVGEVGLVALAALSLAPATRGPRALNRFTWGPLVEVAVVFAGIFATIAPAIVILRARGGELGIAHPWQFFWASGGLSAFLDSAPAYLSFTSAAQGLLHLGSPADLSSAAVAPAVGHSPANFLAAISVGTVFMGAMTYVGNAPNLMVRAIAEENGCRMPSFFRYMAWSTAVLLPVFAVVSLLFFR
jgi:Na+/H+ antiporter NhaD/arsenite permease-like protein